MNWDEALKFFRDEIEEIEAQGETPLDWREDFKAAFAALSSCACGGETPIAIKEGLWSGSEVEGVQMLQEVRILFFALPVEEGT